MSAPPAPGEIVFDVLAFPINPADISFCRGNYRLHPPCRRHRARNASAGSRRSAPGSPTSGRATSSSTCSARTGCSAAALPPPTRSHCPAGLDLEQAAMLRINPATALLLLEDHVALKPGDWVIQDVANSAVGRHLIVLAKAKGVRTAQRRAPRRCDRAN